MQEDTGFFEMGTLRFPAAALPETNSSVMTNETDKKNLSI